MAERKDDQPELWLPVRHGNVPTKETVGRCVVPRGEGEEWRGIHRQEDREFFAT